MRSFYSAQVSVIAVLTAAANAVLLLTLQMTGSVNWFTTVLSAIATLGAALGARLSIRNRAELHTALWVKFSELSAKLEVWPMDEKHLARARAERARIEATEPPQKDLVVHQSYNQEIRARGINPDNEIPLNRLQRSRLAYVFTFGTDRINRWISRRNSNGGSIEALFPPEPG
jgi:hypothetical protein